MLQTRVFDLRKVYSLRRGGAWSLGWPWAVPHEDKPTASSLSLSLGTTTYEAPPQKKCNMLVVWLKPLPNLDEQGKPRSLIEICMQRDVLLYSYSIIQAIMAPRLYIDIGIRIQCLVLLEYSILIDIVSFITKVNLPISTNSY